MSTLKDFSELYRLKNVKKDFLICIRDKLHAAIKDQLRDIKTKARVRN